MNLTLCLVAMMLIPLAWAGLMLIHQGLGRSRSAAHTMLASLCAVAIAGIVFVLVGSAWAGYFGGLAHFLRIGGVEWNWLGAEPFLGKGMDVGNPRPALVLCLQMFAAGTVVLIPISAGTDRWRLGSICVASAALAGVLYPLFAHWVWGGGWLALMPDMFRVPAFVDFGGAGTIQVVGGFAALSTAWILGPRRGKYTDGMATAIPGHNVVLALFGCVLALVGWIGLDASASMLFYGADLEQVVRAAINATLSAGAGCLAAVGATQLRYRKPDASLSANGWIAGLVAGSAGCGFVSAGAAVATGVVAGGLVTVLVERFELNLKIDDPGGAVSVHAGAGLWGLIALSIFGPTADGTGMGHLVAQLVGIATLLGCMLPLIHGLNLLVNWIVPFRVDRDGDWQGMDVRELGAGAYPEFAIHADEFVPR
jgi:Amt family ammonium transporter